jgi:hypothetical protein
MPWTVAGVMQQFMPHLGNSSPLCKGLRDFRWQLLSLVMILRSVSIWFSCSVMTLSVLIWLQFFEQLWTCNILIFTLGSTHFSCRTAFHTGQVQYRSRSWSNKGFRIYDWAGTHCLSLLHISCSAFSWRVLKSHSLILIYIETHFQYYIHRMTTEVLIRDKCNYEKQLIFIKENSVEQE